MIDLLKAVEDAISSWESDEEDRVPWSDMNKLRQEFMTTFHPNYVVCVDDGPVVPFGNRGDLHIVKGKLYVSYDDGAVCHGGVCWSHSRFRPATIRDVLDAKLPLDHAEYEANDQ